MKTLSLVTLSALFALIVVHAGAKPADKLEQQIIANERQELDSLKTGDVRTFASLIADEAVFVDARGTAGKAEVVSHVSDFKVLEYAMENVRFVRLSDKSGIIAYKLTQKATALGREFSSTAYASAMWVQRNGKWVCLFSQETAAR